MGPMKEGEPHASLLATAMARSVLTNYYTTCCNTQLSSGVSGHDRGMDVILAYNVLLVSGRLVVPSTFTSYSLNLSRSLSLIHCLPSILEHSQTQRGIRRSADGRTLESRRQEESV